LIINYFKTIDFRLCFLLLNAQVSKSNAADKAINPNCALEKLKRFLSIAPSFSWGFINIMDWL
jgi:hypothetical protein